MAFNYKGWTLPDAIDALMAYDAGFTDSGVRDEAMKVAVGDYLRSLDDKDFNRLMLGYVSEYYASPARIEEGYGLADVKAFLDWLSDELGIDV